MDVSAGKIGRNGMGGLRMAAVGAGQWIFGKQTWRRGPKPRESGRQSTAKCIVTISRTMYILRLKYTVKRHMRIPLLQGIVSGLAHRMHGLRFCACVDAFISIVLCALWYMFARTSPPPAAL